jgi:cold shock CspA family protein
MKHGLARKIFATRHYGFILDDSGKEWFFHTSVMEGPIVEGDEVYFELGEARGRTAAIKVTLAAPVVSQQIGGDRE